MASCAPETVIRIVERILELPEVAPDAALALSMDTTAEWDSLRHLQIMFAIEAAFGLFVEPEDAIRLTSVRAIVEFVGRKLAGAGRGPGSIVP